MKTVTLINPWSGAMAFEMTWLQIKSWAKQNVHENNRRLWLREAREAFACDDGKTLGTMIIGG